MKLKEGRDERLQLFVMGEEDIQVVATQEKFGYPYILKFGEEHDVTGYRVKKCFTYDPTQGAFSGQISSYGSIVKEVLSIKFIVCKARDLLVVRYSVRLKHC